MLLISKKVKYFNYYSKESFEHIHYWVNELKTNSSPDVKIFLVGSKCDLEKE